MASFNKVLLMGNLTRDPEVRTTPSGLVIAKLGMAVNRRYRTKEGEQREEVTYVDIDAFGPQAEVIQKYCSKGSGLMVEGRLKLDQWQDKTSGENRSKLGVVLENFQFIGGKSDSAHEAAGSYGEVDSEAPTRPAARSASATGSDMVEDDDNVPF